MIVKTVTYQKAFWIGSYLQHKIGIEIELEKLEIPEEALRYAKIVVDNWDKENNPIASNQPPDNVSLPIDQISKTPKEAAIDSQIEAINGCTSLKSLEIFRKLVFRENDNRLADAFNNKEKSLQLLQK